MRTLARRAPNSGSISLTSRGRFRVQIVDDAGRRSLGEYATRDEAEGVLAAALKRLAQGDVGPGLLFGTHCETVLDRRERSGKRTVDDDKNRFKNHIEPHDIASTPIKALKSGDVLRWLDYMMRKFAADHRGRRRRTLSRQTIVNALNLVRAVFADALARNIIESNPAFEVRVPLAESATAKKWKYLTLDEQVAIRTSVLVDEQGEPLDANHRRVEEENRRLVTFAIYTGLRQGEQWLLELDDVHVDQDEPEPFVVVRYGSIKHGRKRPPKNGKEREVSLFGPALVAAREQIAELKRRARLVGEEKSNPFGLLWPSERGCRRAKGDPVGWARLKASAGITRSIRWHDLRHTCGTSLISGMWGLDGAPARDGVLGVAWSREEVQAMLGHDSASSTERYAKLAPTVLKRAAARMRLVAPPPAPELPPAPAALPQLPPAAAISPIGEARTKHARGSGSSRNSRSHLGNLNPGPTVYEAEAKPNDIAGLTRHEARLRASKALAAAAAGKHAGLIELAARILDETSDLEAAPDEGAETG